jgi:medium-chain acyl-[acyl-carrier-protein] hydrolase
MNERSNGLAGRGLSPWLTRLNQGAEQVRLVCFPYAGGSSVTFHPWRSELPENIGLYSAHLPGRGQRFREPPIERMAPIADALATAIEPLLDRPTVFFGHSMGALVAFETTRALRRLKSPLPAHLFVSGYSAPELPRPNRPIHALPQPELVQELRDLNGTPPEILNNPDFLELVIPIIRADFAVIETYEYAAEPPLACAISAVSGLEDDSHSAERMLGWRAHTLSRFSRHALPGDHFFLHGAKRELTLLIAKEFGRYQNALGAAD